MKKPFFHPPTENAGRVDDPPPSPLTQEAMLQRMQEFSDHMERLGLADYMQYVSNRKRLFWSNFMGGMARGLGMAVGFTILGALLILFLQDLAQHNLPIIGDMIADIVSVVQKRLQ